MLLFYCYFFTFMYNNYLVIYMNKIVIGEEEKRAIEIYAEYLKSNGFVLPEDYILECVRDPKYSVAWNEIFHEYSKIVFCNQLPNLIRINQARDEVENHYHKNVNFISNAFNDHIEDYINELLPNCYFNLGICSSNTKEYLYGKMSLVRYEEELVAQGINVEHIEDKVDNNKIYLLSNRRHNNVKK